jgi:hypothetical protein
VAIGIFYTASGVVAAELENDIAGTHRTRGWVACLAVGQNALGAGYDIFYSWLIK